MQTSQRALLALSASTLVAGETANPLSTVISLMDELTAKVTKDGEAEAKAYHEYFEWCDETTKNAGFAIKTAESDKKKLEATIGELKSEVEGADTKIEELAASTADGEKELKDATVIREKEAADFAANDEELMEGIDALSRASGILSKELAKNPASFAQMDTMSTANAIQALSVVLDAASFNSQDQNKLLALVQASDDDEDSGAPAAAVYKSKAGNIVDVIEDMKEKAEGQLSDLRKAEVTAKQNFAMLKNSLDAQVADDQKHLDDEKSGKATAEEDKATAEKDLDVTVNELTSQTEQLATARGSCLQTAADHEASNVARKEELGVIATAKKILKEATSGAESKTYSLLQMQSQADLAGSEVVAVVKRLAKQQKSPALAQLASRIMGMMRHRSRGDVFGKVKGLIQDMIGKLEKEADADAEEKAWCDEQMSKTAAKQGDLEDDLAKATARIDAADAKSAKLQEELQVLAGELAALKKEQAELDNIRAEEHADYEVAKSDLEQGLTGVRKALAVLQEYYGAASASMLQEEQPAKPEGFQKASGAGGSIIDILQTVESDFATNLAKVEAEESDSQSEYEKVTQANEVTKTSKEGDEKYKSQEVKALGKTSAEYKGDRDTAKTELAAVNEYYGKVKDRCIAKPETYEDRKARRVAEIEGLKQALTILENEAAFVQRRHRGHGFLHAA